MEKKYKKLIKNTIIFSIGSLGSKVLSFLIVPLYTFVLTTAEYGKIDLFTTAISLMLPFTTLLMQEALIRFVPANEVDETEAVSNSFMVVLFGCFVILLCTPLYFYGFQFGQYTVLYILTLFLNTYTTIFGQYLRASGRNEAFAINGCITTVVLLGCNVLFLLVLKIGMVGYFYSLVLSQIASAVHATICGRLFQHFSLARVNKAKLKEMLRYSIPLIPNSLMWWIMNAGDKYIINYFLGDSANGIYSIAMKIPTIINLVYTIFMQAWQISAIEENNHEGYADFYDSVFSTLSALMGILSAGIIMLVHFVFSAVLNESYLSAWQYVPFLCIATVISCFATFAGTTYTVTKRSSKAFVTTVIGAVFNLAANFLLIGSMGLFGVALGTILGYLVVMLIRFHDMKRDMQIALDVRKFVVLLVFLCIESLCVIKFQGVGKLGIGLAALVLISLLYHRELDKALHILVRKRK